MAITTAPLITTGSRVSQAFSMGTVTGTATRLMNMTQIVTTGPTGQFSIPTTASSGGEIPTKATAGAMMNYPAASGSNRHYLAEFEYSYSATSQGGVLLVDRVYAVSGFDGTVTTPQTITAMPALTRPSVTGLNLMLCVEFYANNGASASNITVTYTNQSGTASRTSVSTALPTSCVKGTVVPLPLQAGDTGVQSIQSITLSATTGTAGNIGLSLYAPLQAAGSAGGNIVRLDTIQMGMPRVFPSACLTLLGLGTSSYGVGNITLVQG